MEGRLGWRARYVKIADLDEKTVLFFQVGVANVKAFGLTWEDYYEFLSSFGYRVEVKAQILTSIVLRNCL